MSCYVNTVSQRVLLIKHKVVNFFFYSFYQNNAIGFIDYRSRFRISRLFYSSLCFSYDKFSTGGQSYHWKGCNAAQWQEGVLKILYHKDTALCKKMQNIFAFCTICTKIYIKMICFFGSLLKNHYFCSHKYGKRKNDPTSYSRQDYTGQSILRQGSK